MATPNVAPLRHEGRNPSLDVLRAAAVIAVVNCHIVSGFSSIRHIPVNGGWLRVIQFGGHGVDLFFVLSGWLLGSILAREFIDRGSIDVRRFILRRWLRTLPAYYAVLAALSLQQLLKGAPFPWGHLVFLQNYIGRLEVFSVSWSLCVEEHFYLIIGPLLLFLLPRPRWFLCGFFILILCPVIARHFGLGESHHTHVRIDQCAVGVCLACTNVIFPRLYHRLSRTILIMLPLAVALAVWQVWLRYTGQHDLPTETVTYLFASLIVLGSSGDFFSRRLYVPGARFVAERSYAVYLLHVEGIALANYFPQMHQSLSVYAMVVWATSFLLAELLYRFVERPGMRVRGRWRLTQSQVSPAIQVT